jgi:hypothetical protein
MKRHKFKSNKKSGNSRLRTCYNCGKSGYFIVNCPYEKNEEKEEKEEKNIYTKNKKIFKKRHSGEAHIGKEWDSNHETSDSSEDEGISILAFNKSSLFLKLNHTCLMDKEGRNHTKSFSKVYY